MADRKFQISTHVSDELHRQLTISRQWHRRSMAGEIEFRLRRAFELEGIKGNGALTESSQCLEDFQNGGR